MGQQLFPIVGLGASAGGLEALTTFFDHLPSEVGIGFVVVTHTAPDRKSLLPELLTPHCRMPIVVVSEPVKVKPNHVYLSPAGDRIEIRDGILHRIQDPSRERLPIDLLFRTLAQDQKERAIGVVLSGTGSDGTLGLEEIKGGGGMVMAQDSARFPGMPDSAIETHLVDFVMRVEELPKQLVAYVQAAFQNGVARTIPPEAIADLDRLFLLLRLRTGHDFADYKRTTILRRIERRTHLHQLTSVSAYLDFIQENPAELDVLFKELLIGVTSFFRDADAFRVLSERAIPELLADKPDDYVVRAWVTGCSTGEEAYSIGIMLCEVMERLERRLGIQIFATDLDSHAIEYARAGLYPASISADVGSDRLARFFTKEDDYYRIRKEVREKLIFSPHNVLEDPPFTKVDVLSCRNLLIYLDGKPQQRLIPLFHYSLRRDGILFLGSSESIGAYGHLFEVVDKKWKVFRRKDVSPARMSDFPSLVSHDETRREIPPAVLPAKAEEMRLGKVIERMLLEEVVPPSVLIHEHGDVVHVQGRTGEFLEPAPGPQSRVNVFQMLRENLQLDLAAAIRRASLEKRDVLHEGVRVKSNGSWTVCDLRVRRVEEPASLRGLFLVSFERARSAGAEDAIVDITTSAEAEDRLTELGRDLQRVREYHLSAIEELETANEELKSTNEELQSTNEELQSTNEELETSKEEMQSLNEELQTVNAELEGKLEELSRTNDDMKNLFNGTDIATLFLDNDLRIKRYTDRAKKVINLIPSDVGRPLGDLVTTLSYDGLVEQAREVLRTLVFKEIEVQTRGGDWFLMRILPYRTGDNVIDGIVITFVDTTKIKRLQSTQARILHALENSPTLLFSQDIELRYDWVSGPLFGHPADLVLHKRDVDLLPAPEAEKLNELKRRTLFGGEVVRERLELGTAAGRACYGLYLEAHSEGGAVVGIIGSMTRY